MTATRKPTPTVYRAAKTCQAPSLTKSATKPMSRQTIVVSAPQTPA
jgi:RNA:NAD 2'-phosphotransferase (TPT1/KptA family)|tara:strand:- start:342 stop:479 length:138 start_codon:yes stop_codon:yes gene_type:complete